MALSRLKSLSDGIIQPMSFKWLESIGNSKGLRYRIEEEDELRSIALTSHYYIAN